MPNYVADGLPLGLRFYDSIGKQKRYQYGCRKGVTHHEYQYSNECYLPPFQIVRNPHPSSDFTLWIVCVDDETEFDTSSVCADIISNITLKTVGYFDYITYPATHGCCNFPFGKMLVYLKFEDGINTWYSELFWLIGTETETIEDPSTYYREWHPVGNNLRIADLTDFRTFE
jgi:hypothetical protein